MRGDNELDAKIDAALRSYAEPVSIPEPRTMALRLLKQVEAQRAQRARLWAWAIPITACALALLAIAVSTMRAPRTPAIAWTPPELAVASPGTEANRTHAAPALQRGPRRPAATRTRTRDAAIRTSRQRELPRLDVFPAPAPLTPEEKELLALANHGSANQKQAVIAFQQHWDDPIVIARLKIRPLDADDQPDSTDDETERNRDLP